MKSVLFPTILLATLLPPGTALAQTKTNSQDSRISDKASPASSRESISEKSLKTEETASAKDVTANPGARVVGVEKPRGRDSSSPEARKYYDSGVAFLESSKFDEAVEAFKQAVKWEPGNAQAQYSLGIAYSKSNKYPEAAESFKRAARLKPDWAEAHFGLGCVYYVLDKRNQALDEYKKLQGLNSPQAGMLLRIINDGMVSLAASNRQPLSSKPNETKGNESVSRSAAKKEGSNKSDSGLPTSDHARVVTEQQGQNSPSTVGVPLVAANGNSTRAVTSSPASFIANTTAGSSTSEAPANDETTLTHTYRVGVGDVIDIRLSFNPSTNRSTLYSVIDQGVIEFPLVGGTVSVVGLTVDEIQARLGAELKRREIQGNTPLSVVVRQYASHPVIVGGLVGFPGTKNLKREAVPLYVLLAEAQPRPDAARAIITREGSPVLTVDLGDPSGLNVLVRPGDVINLSVRPQEFYYIAGRVNYPGQKVHQPGITLFQAILAAGGLTKPSDAAEISREGVAGRLTTTKYHLKEIKSGKVQDPQLQPGDRIEVVH